MALLFNCEHCGEPITVRFLSVGELALCRKCGKNTTVPATAETVADDCTSARAGFSAGLGASTSVVPSRQEAAAPLTGIPLLIRNLLLVGLGQFLIINIYMNSGEWSFEWSGSQAMWLGNSLLVVDSRKDVEYVKGTEADQLWGDEGLLFALICDSSSDGYQTRVMADYFHLEDVRDYKALEEYLREWTTDSIVSIRISRNSLETILYIHSPPGEPYYAYNRYQKVFPYYLRLSASYYNGPEPPDDVMRLINLVEIERQ